MAAQNELARVLVIDNDPQVGIDLCEMLEPLGYTVKFICTDGLDVPGAIIEDARIFRPHVAIVDVRLVDDYTPDSHTVFDLLGYLKSARCVLYSAYLDANVTRKANREQVFDWLSKAGEPADLIEAVKNGAATTSARTAKASTPWPDDFDKQRMLSRMNATEAEEAPNSLIDDVLHQLLLSQQAIQSIEDHQTIELRRMRRRLQGSIAASRGHSEVFEMKTQEFAPSVLKLAKATRILEERERYRKYIHNRVPGNFHTQLLGSVDFWEAGAALYSLIGTDETALPTFSEHYQARTEREADLITAPIAAFVQEVWHTYYRKRQSLNELSIFSLYNETFDICARLGRIDSVSITDDCGYTYEDITELKRWANDFDKNSKVVGAHKAITHGDFHGDNIFVGNGIAWVIDFERTGVNHILLDFVELQVDILTRLVPADEVDTTVFSSLVRACVSRSTNRDMQQVRRNPHCDKAWKVVTRLQQIAAEEYSDYSHEEMLWGMLFDALYVATIEHIPLHQRERALHLGIAVMRQLKQVS